MLDSNNFEKLLVEQFNGLFESEILQDEGSMKHGMYYNVLVVPLVYPQRCTIKVGPRRHLLGAYAISSSQLNPNVKSQT